MNTLYSSLHVAIGLALVLPGTGGWAQESEPEAVVELPPFVVTGILDGPPWRYAQTEGFEILTQASTRETCEVFAALRRGRRMVLPPSLVPRFSVPMTVILFDQPTVLPTALRTLGSVRGENELTSHWTNLIKRTASERESFSLNLWRADFSYSVDFRFDTRTLLKRRTPAAPAWLTEGLFGRYGLYREGWIWQPGDKFRRVVKASWFSPEETRQALGCHQRALAHGEDSAERVNERMDLIGLLALIPDFPTLLGIRPVVGPDIARGSTVETKPTPGPKPRVPAEAFITLPKVSVTSDFHERWASAAALFVRWGLYGRTPEDAEKFWRFAERSCSEPVTETLFEECFGLSFAAARFELACYLPQAVAQSGSILAGDAAPPVLKIRAATAEEIARLRGEWDRLEALSLAARFPGLAQQYREQAARRFERAYRNGSRDPRLMASMGLLALDGGDPARARPLLEAAAAQHVAGPLVYLELARLRWLEAEAAGKDAQADRMVSGVVELLLLAERQSPALPAVYGFLAEITLQTKATSSRQTAALRRGLDHFPKAPAVRARIEAALRLVEPSTEKEKSP